MKSLIHLAAFFLLVNCTMNKKNEFNASLYIDLPQSGEDTLKASFFADTVMYVPLEATNESYIQFTKQLFIDDSVIYVNSFPGGLLQFQINGKFLRRIGKTGHGPGEYTGIMNFSVINDTIYVSSAGKTSLSRYTTQGQFIDDLVFDYNPFYFNSTIDEKLVCYNSHKGLVLIYNKNFNSPDTIVVDYDVTTGQNEFILSDFFNTYYFQKTSNGLIFNNYRSDTIWDILNHSKEPRFIFDLKDRLLPDSKQFKFYSADYETWKETVKKYVSINVIPHSNYLLIFQKPLNTDRFVAIYIQNMKTGLVHKFNTWFIYDDIAGKAKLYLIFPVVSKDYIAAMGSWKTISELEANKGSRSVSPSPQWLKQMKSIDEYANPILVLLKIKKD